MKKASSRLKNGCSSLKKSYRKTTDTILYHLENISKTYQGKQLDYTALRDVNLDIEQGISLTIVGKSGSGKSTLLNILALMDSYTTGKMIIQSDGEPKNVTELTEKEKNVLRASTFGFVFQQFFLNDNLTVLENVMIPLEIANVKREQRKQMAEDALKMVDLLDKSNNMAGELSGGQKQRVCIARAIVNNPKIIFADEPTGNLDDENSKLIEDLLFQIAKNTNATLLIVTHDTDLANKCERQISIKNSQVKAS